MTLLLIKACILLAASAVFAASTAFFLFRDDEFFLEDIKDLDDRGLLAIGT